VAAKLPMLIDHRPLDDAETNLLRRRLPRPLPFNRKITARVSAFSLRGTYWIGVGLVGLRQLPGPCLYWQLAGTHQVGADCFLLDTVIRGRAVSLFGRKPDMEVIGIVPPHTKSVVAVGKNRGREPLRIERQTYSGHMRFAPRRIEVEQADGTRVKIALG
jgi:hypothetical protein